MTRLRLTPRAEEDVAEIVEYILDASGARHAEAVRRASLDAARQLAAMPGMGHSREDPTDEPVLFWAVHSCLIVYRAGSAPLEIVRVVSGRRDLQVELEKDPEHGGEQSSAG